MITGANVSPMLSTIINKGSATMRELQEYYTMEDALNLYEIIIVDNYNQRVLSEE